ncbi:unnamed protein product [Tilletia controversa]|nr:unnamed protein product [Tilletia controversa]
MERMLFSTLTGSIQIDSIERQKAWYQFKGICLMGQSTSAECEVVGTIYDAGTIKLPSVVEVAAGLIGITTKGELNLTVHRWEVLCPAEDVSHTIAPPVMTGVGQVSEVNQAKALIKYKSAGYNRQDGRTLITEYCSVRDSLRWKNVPYAQVGNFIAIIGQLHHVESVSNVLFITLDDAAWTSIGAGTHQSPTAAPGARKFLGKRKRNEQETNGEPCTSTSASASSAATSTSATVLVE